MTDFQDKVVVITGGASGVGRSLAFAFGSRGAKIVIADIDHNALSKTTPELIEAGITASGEICDVTSVDSLKQLAQTAIDLHGCIDIVFANAGIASGEAGNMWDYSEKDWQWSLSVNLWGPINSIRAFMPVLIEQNHETHFVITGSGNGGLIVLPDVPIYTATKAAVQTITENLFYQTEGTSVNVHALFPGPHVVDTGLFNSSRVRPEQYNKEEGNTNETGINCVDDMVKLCEFMGVKLEVTHPDEVAAMAVKGIGNNQFWILETTEDTDNKIKQRFDAINNRTNPVKPVWGG